LAVAELYYWDNYLSSPVGILITCYFKNKIKQLGMKIIVSLLLLLTSAIGLSGQVSIGEQLKINKNWKFQMGDPRAAASPDYDDSRWRQLDLPHDWSAEGPYSPHLASATGYLPGGIAWYRKSLEIPAGMQDKKVFIYFEGVYRDGEVFINGISLGMRPNGYISYMHDLTPYINFGGENKIAVRVDHSKSADSRWYTGSGIYRDVYLVYANPVHIELWGVHYTTPRVTSASATLKAHTSLINTTGRRANIRVEQEVVDKEGRAITRATRTINVPAGGSDVLIQDINVAKPRLWSVEDPYLYKLKTSVFHDGKLVDNSVVNVGIRTFSFDANKGFFLNGVSMKMKGVCIHHDAGSLGAAVPAEVWRRRLIALKSTGTNAIRTSHNPQAPILYELCDELGLLVINEAFDEWEYPKKKWLQGWNVGTPGFQGHAEFFEEWGETDLRDMILRDRNHPSVIMWSIGNEVDYPNDPYSHPILDKDGIQQQHTSGYLTGQPHADRLGAIAKRLAAVVRQHDPSRPVTAGLAGPVMSNETDYPGELDVVGYNYTERRYAQDHETYPERVFYGSENGHSLDAWKAVRDNEYIFGQFLWTGIDYLGESHRWPSRGFTSGLIDLAGYKKPRAFFRESLWSDKPMIYLGSYPKRRNERVPSTDAPSTWNYRVGDTITVVSYTNCQQAQLLLNGQKIGELREYNDRTGIISWEVPYRPGKLEVIGYNSNMEAARYSVETSGQPHAVSARLYNNPVNPENGVAQIEIQIVDREGKPVFLADNELTILTEGPVRLLGLEASNPSDMGDYKGNTIRVYQGRMIAYVQATGEKGTGSVTLSSPWLEGAVMKINIE
jgi:beta-galactosidase